MAVRIFLVAVIAALLKPPEGWPAQGNLDSLAGVLRVELSTLTTPELEARRETRRAMQQHAYAAILQEAVRGDGLLTLLAWLRATLQLQYALPRNTLVVYLPPPERRRPAGMLDRLTPPPGPPIPIMLNEDRSFPRDPWKRREKP